MNDLDPVVKALRRFVTDRDWSQFHDPKNLAMALASEVGELCALYRWVRSEDADGFSRDPKNRPRIEDEMADVAIFLLLLADRTGVDLAEVALRKIAGNDVRYPVAASRGRSEKPETPGL
ncbi:MAG TPA: nucleotide pyrophosphohydrolase [Myxococcota bacterium]|mgnify:CR=1 FL=1|nr:nucleotide pyrophosphohydrolase [Myxococcota bacterium]